MSSDVEVDAWETPTKLLGAQALNGGNEESPTGRDLYSLKRRNKTINRYLQATPVKVADRIPDSEEGESVNESDQDKENSVALRESTRRISRNSKKETSAPAKGPKISSKVTKETKSKSRCPGAKDKRTKRKVTSKIKKLLEDPNGSNSSCESSDEESNVAPEAELADKDQFFSNAKAKTSNNTLKFVSQTPAQMREALAGFKDRHAHLSKSLQARYPPHFDQWSFELNQNFNLMFYGYGSKRDLINNYVESHLADQPSVTINGYYPTLSLKTVISQLLLELVGQAPGIGSTLNKVKLLTSHLEKTEMCITIVVHNIDNPSLASDQSLLSALASHNNIYFICSSDHLNTALLWDSERINQFNFVWHDVTTFASYDVENSFDVSLVSNRNINGAKGAVYILQSLTMNARKLFKMICKNQLKCTDEDKGVSFERLFRMANESFIVENQLMFRTLLTEFRDHKLILSKTTEMGEMLYVNVTDRLEELINTI